MNRQIFFRKFPSHYLSIFVAALIFRFWGLENIPGINADEADYGVRVLDLLSGTAGISLRTNTGNILNPFYTGILFILQPFLPTSFWVLRLPALITGIALIPTSYLLVRNLYGHRTALTVALLTACLPVNLAYSRFGWDTSQTTFACLLILYLAMTRKWIWLSIAGFASFLIHPTNIFLIPAAVAPLLSNLMASERKTSGKIHLVIILITFSTACALALLVINPDIFRAAAILLPQALENLFNIRGWLRFFFNCIQLLTGTTTFRYICGSGYGSVQLFTDGLFAALFLALLARGWMTLRASKKRREMSFIIGLFLSMSLFYLVTGNFAIEQPYERYALFLVMPALLAIGILLSSIYEGSAQNERKMIRYVCLSCLFFLISFVLYYFVFLYQTGGEAEISFRTNTVEPKKAAFNLIMENAEPADEILIIPSSWWNQRPIEYLSRGIEHIRFADSRILKSRPLQIFNPGRSVYAVTFFHDSIYWLIVNYYLKNVEETFLVRDYQERPLLVIFKLGTGKKIPPEIVPVS